MLMKNFREIKIAFLSQIQYSKKMSAANASFHFLLFLMNWRDALEREWLEHLIHRLISFTFSPWKLTQAPF